MTGWGPVEGDDVVGTASARLLAAGTSRRDRLQALALLGVLGDHADASGRVRLPLDLLAGEFYVPVERANRLLEMLIEVELVAVAGDGLVVTAREPAVKGGLRLAGFLANVEAVLADGGSSADHPDLDDAAPRRRRSAPTVDRRRTRSREVVLAAVAAAVLVMAPSLAPSSGRPTALRTVDRGAPALLGPQAAGDAGPEAAAGPGAEPEPPSPAASPVPVAGIDQPSPVTGAGGREAGEGQSPVGVGSAGGTTGALPRSGSAPAPAPAPSPQSSAPRGGAVRPDVPPAGPAAPPSTVVCPEGVPVTHVGSVTGGPGLLGGLPGAQPVGVSGTLFNPTGHDVVVESLVVEVGQPPRVGVQALAAPVPLAAGETRTWNVSVSGVGPQLGPLTAQSRVLSWSWLDGALSSGCPS